MHGANATKRLIAMAAALAALTGIAPAMAGPTLRPLRQAELGRGLRYKGSFERAVEWSDNNGRNVVVFSTRSGRNGELQERYLYATHFAGNKQLRVIKDRVDACEFDLTADFVDASIGVTDLDGDGYGEITFAYRLACRSDVSPSTLKLLLLENGNKYIIRGTSKIADGDNGSYGGDKNVDRSFAKGPKPFLAHAQRVWERIVNE